MQRHTPVKVKGIPQRSVLYPPSLDPTKLAIPKISKTPLNALSLTSEKERRYGDR